MPLAVPITGEALARGLRSEFRNTWQRRFRGLEAELGKMVDLAISSDKIEELYGYGEPPQYPKRRPWGDPVQTKGFRFRNFPVENVAWSSAVQWFKHQRLFDQLKDLPRLARQGGENFATLPQRVSIRQIIGNVSDPDLLETIPNAPDGVPLHNALDGDGNDRFQVSGGNIEGGSGVGSSAAIRTDVFNSLERIGQFLDPEGQPAVDIGLTKKFTVLFPVTLWEVMLEAFKQTRTLDGGAALTNIIMDAGLQVTLLPTPFLTGSDYYVFLDDFQPKPIFEQIAQPLDEQVQVEGNSDQSRSQKVEGIFWETIRGYGVNLPLGTVKIDN
jgi:hypothetical protein